MRKECRSQRLHTRSEKGPEPFVAGLLPVLGLRHFADDTTGVPYGIALGLGGLLTYPDSPLMVWALARLAA